MTTESQTPRSPMRRAVAFGVMLAVVTFAIRFVFNDGDPTRLYSPSPLFAGLMLGMVIYFQDSGRTRETATVFITLGAGGLIFYAVLLAFGVGPITRFDWPALVIILLFPLIVLVQGLRMRARATRSNAP